MDRRQTGTLAENSAAAFLESQGFTIIARNFQRRIGEIDVVARAGELLVVAEVRTRASDRFGGAAASITRASNGESPPPLHCSCSDAPTCVTAACAST